ncbi:alpha-tectorin-like isoform X2 [Scomber scombrus]|uniref:Alpha-tectorin-like isoform X2 n=1 Tax=Scomber scombrus TaxID=13677 RepID=A0AAV1Q2W9_SCOSC
MLRLLLCVAALSRLAGANTESIPAEIDISSCSISYFGQVYDKLYVGSDSGKLTVCFKAAYSSGADNDCLVASLSTVTQVSWLKEDNVVNAGSDYHTTLKFTGSSSCGAILNLKDANGKVHINYHFRTFGKLAGMQIKLEDTTASLAVDVQVGGKQLHQWSLTKKVTADTKDLSGCRHLGAAYETNTKGCDSKGQSVACSSSAAVSTASCGQTERCKGNGECLFDAICTVTGPEVIDINGQVGSVPDRCGYSLLSGTGFKLFAVFQERRRKDVSFVDHVILHLDAKNVNIQLGPGRNAKVGDSVQSLSSSPKKVHDVELSKDQTGVTAKMTLNKYVVSIFFDGTTAQIQMTGPGAGSLQGLCVNSKKTLSEVKSSDHSLADCEKKLTETPDVKPDCVAMTKHCNLLNEAPFTSCHAHVAPKPYIDVCTKTLCKYPAVDGLQCQFLEAYARACSTYSSDSLTGWKSKASCSAPQVVCQDTDCITHEFCGQDPVGRPRCLCRAKFADKYRSADTLGDKTVCKKNSASVSLPSCLLAEKGIDYSILRLNDETCKGQMDQKTRMVMFDYNSQKACGAVITAKDQKIIYENTIKTDDSGSSGEIYRHGSVKMDFSCFYVQPEVHDFIFKLKGG